MADKPNWRNRGANPGAQPAGKRPWQQSRMQGAAGPHAPFAGRTKQVIAVGLLGAVAVGIVWLIALLAPFRPACVVLFGAHYDTNLALPHNVYGWMGLADLAEIALRKDPPSWFSSDPEAGKLRLQDTATLKVGTAWQTHLEKACENLPERNLILFLALHGSSDGDKAYLLCDDEKGQTHVTLDELLSSLAREELKNKTIVLVLEPALVGSHWPSGMFGNEFVRFLKDAQKRIEEQGNLLVFCASDVGQISWVSEERRQTIFTHFLIEGLKGAADNNNNNRVTAGELFDYVEAHVKSWSVSNRAVVQTPILLGRHELREHELVAPRERERKEQETALDILPGDNYQPSEGLTQAWKQCLALQQMIPGPYVYSPVLWRTYLETLLRYEQLDRAGYSAEKRAELKSKLDGMAERVQRQASLDGAPDKLNLALPLPAVVGLARPLDKGGLGKDFDRLWAAKHEDRAKIFRKLANPVGKEDAHEERSVDPLLPGNFFRLLLEKVPRDLSEAGLAPERNPGSARTSDLITLIQGSQVYRPAEVHFLRMLLQDLDLGTGAEDELLRQALRVRLLAEQAALAVPSGAPAHPYSEVIFPWLRGLVDEADKRRRRGEDWLFAALPEQRRQGAAELEQAENLYKEALARAVLLRDALGTRDRALAELPFLAQWVALQRGNDGKRREDAIKTWLNHVEGLGRSADKLAHALKGIAPADKDTEHKRILDNLRQMTGEVRASQHALEQAFREDCLELEREHHLQSRWHRAEAILAVPLPIDIRMNLLRIHRSNSQELNHKGRAGDTPPAPEPKDDTGIPLSTRRQMMMARAALTPFGAVAENAAQLSRDVRRIYEMMPRKLEEASKDGLDHAELSAACAQLENADHLCRGLPAGAWPRPPEAPTAPQALRRLRLHDLFIGQARRALRDHWAAEKDGSDKPYYLTAAQGYLDLAMKLLDEATAEGGPLEKRKKESQDLLASLKQTGVKPGGKGAQVWTSDQAELSLRWKLQVDRDVYLEPLGVPMAWVHLEGAQTASGSRLTERRSPVEAPDAGLEVKIRKLSAAPAKNDDKKVSASLTTLYRGRRETAPVVITSSPAELIVQRYLVPREAAIAVQLDKSFTFGEICIVLDCSGSMLKKYPAPDSERSRFYYAVQALKQTLASIPDNTSLSVMAFLERDPNQKSPPSVDFRLVRKPGEWHAEAQLEGLVQDVEALEREMREGHSPIAEALVQAKTVGFSEGNNGPKLLLALTDGDDNYTGFLINKGQMLGITSREPGQPEYNKQIRAYLHEAFRDTDIEIHFVCFNNRQGNREEQEEADRAESQFGFVRDRGGTQAFRRPGSFKVQPDATALASDLEKAIRPRLRLLDLQGKQPASFPAEGMSVNYARDKALGSKTLPEGNYRPVLHWLQDEEGGFRLQGGDYLIVKVKQDSKRRALFSRGVLGEILKESDAGLKQKTDSFATRGRKLLSILEHFVDSNDKLEHLLAIEDDSSRPRGKEEVLRQATPRFVWIETKATSSRQSGLVQWHQEYGYPAPTYRVHAESWPLEGGKPAAAQLQTWWAERLPESALSEGVTFDSGVSEIKDRKLRLGSAWLNIESIRAEDLPLPHGPGGAGAPQKCVVVRLQCPDAGKRFLVEADTKAEAEEHLYYSATGRYTAIFWGLPERGPSTFQVVSVDAVKAQAEAQGATASFTLRETIPNRATSLHHKLSGSGGAVTFRRASQ